VKNTEKRSFRQQTGGERLLTHHKEGGRGIADSRKKEGNEIPSSTFLSEKTIRKAEGEKRERSPLTEKDNSSREGSFMRCGERYIPKKSKRGGKEVCDPGGKKEEYTRLGP